MAEPRKKYRYVVKKVVQNPDALKPNMILKVADMPCANEHIIQDICRYYDIPRSMAQGVINFMGRYCLGVVREGMMETIMLAGFGKFAPNIKMLQGKTKRIRAIQNGTQLLYLAIQGKNINFIPQINPIQHDPLQPKTESGQDQFDEEIQEEDDLGDDSWSLEEDEV
jgi:hypothetical protein